jgi:hypothetical protein
MKKTSSILTLTEWRLLDRWTSDYHGCCTTDYVECLDLRKCEGDGLRCDYDLLTASELPSAGDGGAFTVHLEYSGDDENYNKRLALNYFTAVRDALLDCLPPLLPVVPLRALVVAYIEAEPVLPEVKPFSILFCSRQCLVTFRRKFGARFTPYTGLPFLVRYPIYNGPLGNSISEEEEQILQQHLVWEDSDSEDDAEGDEL